MAWTLRPMFEERWKGEQGAGTSASCRGHAGLCKGEDLLAWPSLVAQMVKNLPAMQETQVRPLDLEDPLEKEMAAHSSVLARRISWAEDLGGLQSMGSQSRTGLNG